MQERKRSGVLDLIKIIATILILFHHYQQLLNVRFDGINFYGGTHFYFGYIVELFFVVSGILAVPYIAKIEQGEAFAEFFRKRFLRFFPIMLISTLAYTALLIVFYNTFGGWFWGDPVNLFKVFVSAIGAQVIWGNEICAINNPMWYISVLLVCYVMLYFCVWAAKRLNVRKESLYILLVVIGAVLISREAEWPVLCSRTGRGFAAFFSGVLWERYIHSDHRKKAGIIAFVLITTALMLVSDQTGAAEEGRIAIFFGIAYFPALICCVKTELTERLFTNKIISQMAAFSFEAYVWHVGVYTLIVMACASGKLSIDFSGYGTMFTIVALVELFGMLIYYLIERPIAGRLQKNERKPLA